jgi:branched-chain amino acid transport system permease protein
MKASTAYMLEKMAISIVLAVSLSIVVGFLGELSLGHAGFMCVGAYIGGKVAALMDSGANNHFSLIITIFIGGAVAAVCGFIIGLPALRLKGDYLAIVTLAFGEIVRSIFLNTSEESFGGTLGLSTPRYDKSYFFIYCFLFVLLCLAVTQNLMRSKHGRAITAIRDNEIAAKATGINVTKYKLLAFIVSAFFAGVAGVLFSHSNFTLQSSRFDYNYSIEILVMVVLGGMGSINGSIIAAALITFLDIKLATILTGDLAVLQNLIYALILILVVIYNNAPALKSFRESYNFKKLISKLFKKLTHSEDKDDEGKWDRVPTKIAMDEVLSVDFKVVESTQKPDKGEK